MNKMKAHPRVKARSMVKAPSRGKARSKAPELVFACCGSEKETDPEVARFVRRAIMLKRMITKKPYIKEKVEEIID